MSFKYFLELSLQAIFCGRPFLEILYQSSLGLRGQRRKSARLDRQRSSRLKILLLRLREFPVSAPVPPLPRVRKRPLSRGATRQRGSVALLAEA